MSHILKLVPVLLLLTGFAAIACTSAVDATPTSTETAASPTATSTPDIPATAVATATVADPVDPTSTPMPTREWDLENIQVDDAMVTVTLRVFAGIDVSVSLDGIEPDRVDAKVPILAYVFQNVEDGPHIVLVRDVVGHSLIREIAVPRVGQQVPIMDSAVHRQVRTPITYSTDPPTSGPHWPQWLNCGVYAEELPDELIVHNLEHSNIVVSYNLTSPTEIADLVMAVDNITEFGEWGILRPYPYIAAESVAITAWGVIDIIEGVDPDRIATFFDAYAGQLGPERIACVE